MSPGNSLGWPALLLSLSHALSHQVRLVPELLSLLPSCLLCFRSWHPHEGHIILLYALALSFYPLCLVRPCILTIHVVEGHIHFYPRKTHYRGGTGVISRKTVTHPSLPEMKEMHLRAHCSSLLYGVL